MNRFYIKYIGWLAVGFIILTFLLVKLWGVAFPSVPVFWRGIWIADFVLFLYNCVTMLFCLRIARRNAGHLVSFYLLDKTFRIVLAVGLLMAYFLLAGTGNKIAYSVIFFLYYLYFLCVESYFMVKMETKVTKV